MRDLVELLMYLNSLTKFLIAEITLLIELDIQALKYLRHIFI